MWNKTEAEGKLDEAKGKAKQAVADATGNPRLKDEGQADEAAGKVESAVGHAERKVGEAVENVGKAIKR